MFIRYSTNRMKTQLTKLQKKILDYIKESNKNGKKPSTTNIAMITLSNFVVTKHRLEKLKDKGLIISKQNDSGFLHWETTNKNGVKTK